MMGPQAVLALREADYSVLVTDVGSPEDKDQIERLAAAGDPIDFDGQRVTSAAVDIRDKASVWEAANGASHLVICAVSRWQRRSSFDVNMRGVMNGITAAIAAGHDRFITTGPHWTLAGAQEQLSLSYGIGEDTVPHPGAGLYGITKGLGLEIARVPTNGEYVYITKSHNFHLILGLNCVHILTGAGILGLLSYPHHLPRV